MATAATVQINIYQDHENVARQTVALDHRCLCSFGRPIPSDKRVDYHLHGVDHRIDFDFARVEPRLAQACSKYQAMIGYMKSRWLLIDGGFVKEFSDRTLRCNWQGRPRNLLPSHAGCHYEGVRIRRTLRLQDGLAFNFLLVPGLQIIGVFSMPQAISDDLIYDAAHQTRGGIDTVLDNKPMSHIPSGAHIASATFAPGPTKPELESLSQISNPGIKLARRVTDTVEDAAQASDSYNKVARLLMKYVFIVALSAGAIIALAWMATHVEWQRLKDARELIG